MAWFAKRSAPDENDERKNLILKRLRRAILEREDFQGKTLYGMDNSIPVQIPFPQQPAEASGSSASHSSSNGYKAIRHPLPNLYEAFN